MSYTANIFEFLGDDGEQDNRPRKQASKPAAPTAPKPAAAKPATSATPKAPAAQPAAPQQKAAAPSKPAAAAKKEGDVRPRPQGDAPKGKTDYVKRPPAQPRQNQQGGGAPAAGGGDSERGPPRGPRRDNNREGRPHRGRQFDRRSGTGRPANENKKDGAGKANWGKEGEDAEAGVEGATVSEALEAEGGEQGGAAKVEGGEASAEAGTQEPPKEEEKETKGYDEYLESIKGRTVRGVEAPKIRQAGEGVDQTAWADFKPIEKDDDDVVGGKKKKESAKKETNANNKTGDERVVPIDQLFRVVPSQGAPRGDRDDRRRDRGGRGGNRGGKSPKGPRYGQNAGQQNGGRQFVSVDSDFPSLAGSGGAPATSAAPAATPATQQPPVKA